MKISIDKTGFPLIEIENIGAINMWPITKIQFERFMSESNIFGDKWYDSILKLNPRISHKSFDRSNYEKLFITGIKHEESISFAHWLGADFDLLTLDEWRILYRDLVFYKMTDLSIAELSSTAHTIWLKLGAYSIDLRDFSLMRHGLLEWVREGVDYTTSGKPRQSFFSNAFDPLKNTITPFEERLFCLGFRLIRRHSNDR